MITPQIFFAVLAVLFVAGLWVSARVARPFFAEAGTLTGLPYFLGHIYSLMVFASVMGGWLLITGPALIYTTKLLNNVQ